MADESSLQLLQRYCDGDDRAAFEIHDRYVQRLRALAYKRVAGKLGRRLDSEDVVQLMRALQVGQRIA